MSKLRKMPSGNQKAKEEVLVTLLSGLGLLGPGEGSSPASCLPPETFKTSRGQRGCVRLLDGREVATWA